MIAAAAVLAPTQLRTLLAVALGRTGLRAPVSRVPLGALALSRERLAGGVVQAVALQLAVDAVEAGRAIYRRVYGLPFTFNVYTTHCALTIYTYIHFYIILLVIRGWTLQCTETK